MKNLESRGTVYSLCCKQMKMLSTPWIAGYEDCHKMGFELWNRLKPIIMRLSEEMKRKSRFKKFSVWALDDMPYDYVLCESINKKTGELGLKIGMRSQGRFINETFYLPKEIDMMDWEDVLAYAVKNDYMVGKNNTKVTAFWGR